MPQVLFDDGRRAFRSNIRDLRVQYSGMPAPTLHFAAALIQFSIQPPPPASEIPAPDMVAIAIAVTP